MKKISFGKISPNFAENSVHIKASGTIGVFGPPKEIENIEDDKEGQKVKEVMGITTFGKKAKTFDIQEMIAQVKETAKELMPIREKTETDKSDTEDEESDDGFIGPPIPETINSNTEDKANESDDSFEENIESSEYFIPSSNEAEMVHGTKAVTAISVDPSGARLASGKNINLFYILLLIFFLLLNHYY